MISAQLQALVLYLTYWSSLNLQTTKGLVVPRRNIRRKSRVPRRISTVADQEINIEEGESTRLTKAKLLLEQFTAQDDPSRSTAPGTGGEVPDNYWSNGLLDGSDVVTRYAYRKGVKIAEPLVKYDPVAAEKLLFKQPTKWLVRNVQIAGSISLWAVSVVSDIVANQNRRRQRAQQLQKAISGLGPAIIKAGQALASRPDLLPSEYLEELQKLQDDVPRFSNELAFATVEDELKVSFDDVFELVEEEPIAAASIGQVYKARLRASEYSCNPRVPFRGLNCFILQFFFPSFRW